MPTSVSRWTVASAYQWKINCPLMGHGQGHMTNFLTFGTTLLSLEGTELHISNFVRKLVVASASEWTMRCLLRGRGQGHVIYWKVKGKDAKLFLAPALLHMVQFNTRKDQNVPFQLKSFFSCNFTTYVICFNADNILPVPWLVCLLCLAM